MILWGKSMLKHFLRYLKIAYVCMFYFAFQTQTKSYNQRTSTAASAKYCIGIMSPAKDTKASTAEIKNNNQMKLDKDKAPAKDSAQFEIENDEQSLQIDTTSEGKVEQEDKAESETPTKKIRKIQHSSPQIIENMKEYIDNNTIEKLTTTTLRFWLKERNLHCSTRDKKAELIQKVKNQFVVSEKV